MHRRESVGAIASKPVDDMAYSKPWEGPREITYSKPPASKSTNSTKSETGVEDASRGRDAEVVGRQKVEEALEQLAELLATAQEEGVGTQQVEALRHSMDKLRQTKAV